MLRKHAGDIERHVSIADNRNLSGFEGPFARNVRVSVVPTDEVSSAIGASQVDSGDGEIGVANRSG